MEIMGNPISKRTFSQFTKRCTHFVEQILFPSKCLKCGIYLKIDPLEKPVIDHSFCSACAGKGTTFIEPPFCTVCGVMFKSRSGGNHICESCIRHPIFLEKVRGCIVYQGLAKDAIPMFKYGAKLSLLKSFEPIMVEGFINYFADNDIDIVMPIPLHKKKLRQRGFNQSFLLVRRLEKQVAKIQGTSPAWKIDTRSLKRVKMTDPQTGFDINQRKKNLNKAFAVVQKDKIKGRHILIIDDVFTT